MILWLASCTTTPKAEKSDSPRILPPDPYDENGLIVWQLVGAGQTFTAETESVLLPYWYLEKLFDYIVDTQAVFESM